MLSKIYYFILWIAGEPMSPGEVPPEGERYTYKLVRQYKRLGVWWWVGLGFIIALLTGLIAFFVWLVKHILDYSRK